MSEEKQEKDWLKSYLDESQNTEEDKIINNWARILKKYYDVLISRGFDEWQALELVKLFWKQVDKRNWMKEGLIDPKE